MTVGGNDGGPTDPAMDATALPEDATLRSDVATAATAPGELPIVERSCYHIIDEHGRGGLGRVLRARDKRTGREVAIKEMLLDRDEVARRFRREALITANLQHPAIVPVYEVGQWPSGEPFYAMKLVTGEPLERVIADAATPAARLALLPHVARVADALAYAHSRGIIHRDLKPANVLVGAFGETVVIDWGLAKEVGAGDDEPLRDVMSGSEALTRLGSAMGTPVYMPPEQAAGESVDQRADVYALGAMLYHLLSGTVPYADSKANDIVQEVLDGPPKPLEELAPDVPPDLAAVVRRAMARNPDDRYPSAAEIDDELQRFATGQLIAAHRYTAWELVTRWARRHKAELTIALAALAAVAVLLVMGFQRVARERDAAEAANRASRANLAVVHAELGQRELASERPARALLHLLEAARLREEIDRPLAYLIGRATESVEPVRPAPGLGQVLIDFASDAPRQRLAAAGTGGRLAVWDVGTGQVTSTFSVTAPVYDIAVTADGRVVTVGGELAVWNAHARTRIAAIPEDQLLRAALIPGDERVVVVDAAGGARVLRLSDLSELRRWTAHTAAILVAEVSADGTRLLTVSEGESAALWDLETGALLSRIDGARSGAILSGAGRYVAGRPGALDVADLATGRVLHSLPTDGAPVVEAAHPAGGLVTSIGGSDIDLWNAATAAHVADLPGHLGGAFPYAQFDADGRVVVTGDDRGRLRVWDATTGGRVAYVILPVAEPRAMEFSADGQHLLVLTEAGEAFSVDAGRARSQIPLAGHTDDARRIAYAADGRRVFTASRDGTIRTWDSATGRALQTLSGHEGSIKWIALSSDGARIVSAGADGLRVWSASDGAPQRAIATDVELVHAAFTGGDRLVVAAGSDGVARVWSADTGEPRCATEGVGFELMGLAVAERRGQFVTYGLGPEAALWNVADCTRAGRLATGHKGTLRAAIAPDESRIALSGFLSGLDNEGRAVLLFDLDGGDGQPLRDLREDLVGAIAFDQTGQRLAVGGLTGLVTVWDATTRDVIAELSGADAVIGAVTFAADGDLVVATDDDGRWHVFDASTGALLDTRTGHTGGVYFLASSPDGTQLATAALERTPRLWTVPQWRGTIAELESLARCRIPWQLVDGALASAPLPRDCPGYTRPHDEDAGARSGSVSR